MSVAPGTASVPRLREIADLPGPRGWPVLGNMPQMKVERVHQDVERWAAEYGPLFRMRLGPTTMLVVADHELLGAVLRDRPEGFQRSPRSLQVAREMGLPGPGLFAAEGDVWRNQRRMVMASLAPQHVKSYFPSLVKVTQRLRGRWAKAADSGAWIELQSDLMRYTVDAVAGLAFGTDINTLESDEDVIQRHLDKIFPALFTRSFKMIPTWRFIKRPSDRALDRSVAEIRQAITAFIAQARERLQDDPQRRERPPNLLEAMLVGADQPGSGLGDADVAGNVLTMLLAGEDTTANTLAWMIHLLHRHPPALRRAQDEVRDALGDVTGDAAMPPTLEQLDSFEYLDACAQETMRLKPVAPFMPMMALRESRIGDVRVPKGAMVWGVMRHDSVSEAHFPNALNFEPERWMGDRAAPQRVSMPFGAGARVCPGRYLALLEIKMAMVMLLAHFEIVEVQASGAGAALATERMAFSMGPVGLRMKLGPSAAG
ncbi:hypothetical protein BH11PSE8_BH11PSE8_09430 [soil metagenome]